MAERGRFSIGAAWGPSEVVLPAYLRRTDPRPDIVEVEGKTFIAYDAAFVGSLNPSSAMLERARQPLTPVIIASGK